MENLTREMIRRHRLVLAMLSSKFEIEAENTLRLLRNMEKDLQGWLRCDQERNGAKEAGPKPEPATPRQVDYLKRLGIGMNETLTKQEASLLIDTALRETPGQARETGKEGTGQEEKLNVEVERIG
jgi:hypothetical protein